ncbi:endonuclease/exonuclease/phosphatase family protein [Spongiibacter marinus]|uniref:endonuclease/exonuclease/phosphatase family protein n=1 Tax=Spongiibacter marinus TaxID=354246 RepID=UPI000486E07E|nr:endonuclease/exonuclease/phosphatase family protein [Spongiibacter marinus]
MKIVTWNCNGAFRKKYHALEPMDADILVIQECEDPAQSTKAYREWAGDYLWLGESKNKGIGVFPRKGNTAQGLDWQGEFTVPGLRSRSRSITWRTEDLRLFLPFTINHSTTALAVWTKGKEDHVFGYMGQFWKYLQIHHAELANDHTMVIGDFNSNVQWDKPDRWWSHSDTVAELEELGLRSLYHYRTGEDPGKESKPTLFHQRKQEKPYHIDYVFLSDDLLHSASIEVGDYKDWIALSDHTPLITRF